MLPQKGAGAGGPTATAVELKQAQHALEQASFRMFMEEASFDEKCFQVFVKKLNDYEVRMAHQRDDWCKKKSTRQRQHLISGGKRRQENTHEKIQLLSTIKIWECIESESEWINIELWVSLLPPLRFLCIAGLTNLIQLLAWECSMMCWLGLTNGPMVFNCETMFLLLLLEKCWDLGKF